MMNIMTIEVLYFRKIIMKNNSMKVILEYSPFDNSKQKAKYFEKRI